MDSLGGLLELIYENNPLPSRFFRSFDVVVVVMDRQVSIQYIILFGYHLFPVQSFLSLYHHHYHRSMDRIR